jgi:hypothetical protein
MIAEVTIPAIIVHGAVKGRAGVVGTGPGSRPTVKPGVARLGSGRSEGAAASAVPVMARARAMLSAAVDAATRTRHVTDMEAFRYTGRDVGSVGLVDHPSRRRTVLLTADKLGRTAQPPG